MSAHRPGANRKYINEMTKTTATTHGNKDITSLPTGMRHPAAMLKYAEAVRIYSESDAPLSDIARQCGLTPGGLSNYISRHHRDMLLKKYGIKALDCALRIKKRTGQSIHTHYKYKEAILACSDVAYIEYNISQIAEMFGLDPAALASQLRFHYPEVIPERERVRREQGLADNIPRGARPCCVEAYADAVAMYRDTDLTVRAVADACDVSAGGLAQHLQFYCKPVVREKAARRDASAANAKARRRSMLSAGGRRRSPKPKAAEKYAAAIASLRESPRPVAEVAAEFGLHPDVFREYLQRHEPALAASRGMEHRADGKLVKRSSEEKYAEAIKEYAVSADTLKDIAKRHGLVYGSLSAYVRRNCLAAQESHKKIVATSQKTDNLKTDN